MKITILGSGTSQGIPVIACDCYVCQSSDQKDNRLRASILIEKNGRNYVIDSGPDFRQQMLRENVKTLEAVIFTHEHKDHMAGLDDVRAFNFIEKRDMPIFCTSQVEEALRREYAYVFSGTNYPGIPQLKINNISKNNSFKINDLTLCPIEVMHYKMPVLGFRIDDFAYITDAKTVDNIEMNKLKNLEILIVNCLREEAHISHFNLKEALAFIEALQPKKAYLTHISHIFGTHEEILRKLPENVSVCYDGQVFNI